MYKYISRSNFFEGEIFIIPSALTPSVEQRATTTCSPFQRLTSHDCRLPTTATAASLPKNIHLFIRDLI